MSKTKEYRELQYTSSQLAVVLVGILAIGIVIFALGVSVGKKQGRLAAAVGQPVPEKAESIAAAKPVPAEEKAVPSKTEPGGTADPAKISAEKTAAEKASLQAPPASKPAEAKPADTAPPPAAKKAEGKPSGVKPAAAPAKGTAYFVQVGAVEDKAAAAAFGKKVEGAGFSVVILDPFPTDQKTYYRVRVGPFAGKEEAEAARTKLAAALRKRPTDFFLVKA